MAKSVSLKSSRTKSAAARVLSSRVSYRGPVFSITTDEVEEPGGVRARRDVIRHSGSVVVMPVLESPEVSHEAKQRLADLVVRERKLVAGNFSEPVTTALIGARPIKTRARRVAGGYRVTGRKMFASMLEAADFVMVGASLEGAASVVRRVISRKSSYLTISTTARARNERISEM